jgi:hypothetical protein
MATDFTKVSLGFAEFVSQLIHETFDAILDSQNYQLDKYTELEIALNTPNGMFQKNYLSEEDIKEYQLSIFGIELKANIPVTETISSTLNDIISTENIHKATQGNALTEYGLSALTEFSLSKLIELKKSKIRTLVNHSELARIMVDSGEIKVKLEMFCLNESNAVASSNTPSPKGLSRVSASTIKKSKFDIREIKFDNVHDIKVKELLDNKTQQKTLLIDKSSLMQSTSIKNSIPTLRLIANPLPSSTTTNVFSEVTIKFRTT